MIRSALPGLAIATAVLVVGLLLAFTVGRYPVSMADLFNVLSAKISGHTADASTAQTVILQVRGPRVLAAVLVGAALAVAGTAFQGLFRNPLVSPDILGASSGAALGAVIGTRRDRNPDFGFRRWTARGRCGVSNRLGSAGARSDLGACAHRRSGRRTARCRCRPGEISR